MNEYEGHWLSTLYVKKFHFLEPTPDEIDIRDIANALSKTCRYGGHCNRFYSVAEHSVRLAGFMNTPSKLSALLHDAEEAYVPDIPRPIKAVTKDLQDISFVIQEAILNKYKAIEADWNTIKKLDNRLLVTEAKELGVFNEEWADLGELLDIQTDEFGWNPARARQLFLAAFKECRK